MEQCTNASSYRCLDYQILPEDTEVVRQSLIDGRVLRERQYTAHAHQEGTLALDTEPLRNNPEILDRLLGLYALHPCVADADALSFVPDGATAFAGKLGQHLNKEIIQVYRPKGGSRANLCLASETDEDLAREASRVCIIGDTSGAGFWEHATARALRQANPALDVHAVSALQHDATDPMYESGPDRVARHTLVRQDIPLIDPLRMFKVVSHNDMYHNRSTPHIIDRSPTPETWTREWIADRYYAIRGVLMFMKDPPDPYIVRTCPKPGQYMAFIGIHHAGDDPMQNNYNFLREEWRRFSESTKGRPRIALYEGRPVQNIPKDEASVLTEGREATLIAYWAHQAGIPSKPGEPSRHAIGGHLLDKFPPEHVYYFYLIRQLSQYPRMRPDTRPPVEAYLGQTYDSFCSPLRNWEHFRGDPENLLGWLAATHETIFGSPFDKDDTAFFLDQVAGQMTKTVKNPIQEVAAACHLYRDIHLASLYKDYCEQGVSLFDVRGWQHTYVLDDLTPNLGRPETRKSETNGPTLHELNTLVRIYNFNRWKRGYGL